MCKAVGIFAVGTNRPQADIFEDDEAPCPAGRIELSIKAALSKVMLEKKHALCLWQITQKFPGWFRPILRHRYASFVCDFYDLQDIEI